MTTAEASYVISLDDGLCNGSRSCLPACNYGGLIHVPGEKKPMIDPWSCSGCGTCLTVCPESALRLIRREIA